MPGDPQKALPPQAHDVVNRRGELVFSGASGGRAASTCALEARRPQNSPIRPAYLPEFAMEMISPRAYARRKADVQWRRLGTFTRRGTGRAAPRRKFAARKAFIRPAEAVVRRSRRAVFAAQQARRGAQGWRRRRSRCNRWMAGLRGLSVKMSGMTVQPPKEMRRAPRAGRVARPPWSDGRPAAGRDPR